MVAGKALEVPSFVSAGAMEAEPGIVDTVPVHPRRKIIKREVEALPGLVSIDVPDEKCSLGKVESDSRPGFLGGQGLAVGKFDTVWNDVALALEPSEPRFFESELGVPDRCGKVIEDGCFRRVDVRSVHGHVGDDRNVYLLFHEPGHIPPIVVDDDDIRAEFRADFAESVDPPHVLAASGGNDGIVVRKVWFMAIDA